MNALFQGGLWLADSHVDTIHPIESLPPAKEICLPVKQHRGHAAVTCVNEGERVQAGQRVALADDLVSAHVHTPYSGTVTSITSLDTPFPRDAHMTCVTIATENTLDVDLIKFPAIDRFEQHSSHSLCERLRDAGLVGMGGAMFPTAAKLAAEKERQVDQLIINATESEPYYQCDTALIVEQPMEIVRAAQLALHLSEVKSACFAITERQPDAQKALEQALAKTGDKRLHLEVVSAKYPIGAERQLVKTVTGKEVPIGGFPLDIGVICLNVTTIYHALRAVEQGEPLTERIVTFDGPGFSRAANIRLAIGTSIADVANYLGGYNEEAQRLVVGGPLGGHSLAHDQMPIIKGNGCILALPMENNQDEMPCIRCGECARVCPAQLQPQQLFHSIREQSSMENLHLDSCIECGCCDLVCPSHLPLTGQFKLAKLDQLNRHAEKIEADKRKTDYQAHQLRLSQKTNPKDPT